MGEVQQKYICKICSKSCISGKSLGGHMRVHLARISATKKTAKEKAEIKLDDDQKSSMNQSSGAPLNCYSITDFGDGDQNNSYELRENPKKSWRISDPKHGVSKNWNCCKECGKEFPSLRALSGHMRCHSIKNKQVHRCKECGKGFNSMRAMFGHMKSHSKKSRVANESTESLSDLENLCPVRRKRSRIRYKSTSNPSFSDINASNSAVSELGEAEEAATCLIMLSRVRDCLKFETESSDDDSAYFGAESSRRSKNFFEYDGYFLTDVEKKSKTSAGKLAYCSSGYANAFTEKNVSEFEDLDSKFVAEDQIKFHTEVSDDGQPSIRKVLEPKQSYEFVDCADDSRSSDSTKSTEFDKKILVATGKSEGTSEFFGSKSGNKLTTSVHQSGFEKNSNEANLNIVKDFEKRREYTRRTCQSHCFPGGQTARHEMQGSSSAVDINASSLSVADDDFKLDKLECGDNQLEQESIGAASVSLEFSQSKEHECPICFKVFHSGQTLGGHKRAYYNGFTESKNQEEYVMDKEVSRVQDMFDLNFPVTVNEGTKSEIGFNSWWINRSREHEALVLTN